MDLDRVVRTESRLDNDLALAVAQRIVEEVANCLFHAQAINVEHEPVLHNRLDRAPRVVRLRAEALRYPVDELDGGHAFTTYG